MFICRSYKYSDDDIQFHLDFGLMAPVAMISFARICLFKRLVCAQKFDILSLAFAGRNRAKSWYNALMADLRAVALYSPQFKQCHGWSMARWVELVQQAPQWFQIN
eukprot:5428820-Karenia_brevis.AAC.1